jgi:hypothetical protein
MNGMLASPRVVATTGPGWRERMGVEPTRPRRRDRIRFEDGGRHRTTPAPGAMVAPGAYHPAVRPPDPSPIALTDLTDCGGCAAKLGADVLAEVLVGLCERRGPGRR